MSNSLRVIREAEGLSQEQLASLSGISVRTIGRIETGVRSPYAETMLRLAKALDVPMHVLMATPSEPPANVRPTQSRPGRRSPWLGDQRAVTGPSTGEDTWPA